MSRADLRRNAHAHFVITIEEAFQDDVRRWFGAQIQEMMSTAEGVSLRGGKTDEETWLYKKCTHPCS